MNPKHQLNEKLDWISQGQTLEEQVNRAREVQRQDGTFASFMRMACVDAEKICGVPEGMPDTYKPETDIPDGISDTTARQELRRIKNFMNDGSMQKIPSHKREAAWIQMLEGLHWKEAAILIQIKDRTLFNSYPNLYDVLTQLGVKIDVSPPKMTKSSSSKSKKAPKSV
jgi:hypothetical protein